MITLIFFVVAVNSYRYSWTLDKLNQLSHIPDFLIKYKEDNELTTVTNVYVIDSGIVESKYFYDNIYTQVNKYSEFSVLYDEQGHGTFVTSQISSKYYGITKNVNITSIKVFGAKDDPSSSRELIEALKYVREDCKNTKNNCIINLSIGLSEKHDDTDNLLEEMHDENILIIAAAGNDNKNCNEFTPSHLPFLIIVGSMNYMDIRSSFSNYGNCVDVYTYGEMVPGIALDGNSTSIKSGTSFAAPIITGYISDYWAYYPKLTNQEIQKQFLNNYSVTKYGYRMLVLKNSLLNDLIVILIMNMTCLLYLLIYLCKKMF